MFYFYLFVSELIDNSKSDLMKLKAVTRLGSNATLQLCIPGRRNDSSLNMRTVYNKAYMSIYYSQKVHQHHNQRQEGCADALYTSRPIPAFEAALATLLWFVVAEAFIHIDKLITVFSADFDYIS